MANDSFQIIDATFDYIRHGNHLTAGPFRWLVKAGESWIVECAAESLRTAFLQRVIGYFPVLTGRILQGRQQISPEVMSSSNDHRPKMAGALATANELIPNLTVIENLALPIQYHKIYPDTETMNDALNQIIDFMEIGLLTRKHPSQLDRASNHRVAFARALAMQPSLLVLDMIEGELDDESKAWWSSKISQMITTPSLLAPHSAFILGTASALPSVREFCHLARLKIDSLSIIAQ